ncbi:MAG TPA: hypothetical protein VJL35_01405 [Gemmatimonadaceae bacterium]|nr:hypothetical protein [Gemmatimonadaceae bacterium]
MNQDALAFALKKCGVQPTYTGQIEMDPKKLAALARKNAAKSATNSKIPKNFGKKYDPTLKDVPRDEESLKQMEESARFFAEMKKREF